MQGRCLCQDCRAAPLFSVLVLFPRRSRCVLSHLYPCVCLCLSTNVLAFQGDMGNCSLAPDKAPATDQRNNSVQFGKPRSLLVYYYRSMGDF